MPKPRYTVPDTGSRENVTSPPAGPAGDARKRTCPNERIRLASSHRCHQENTSCKQATSASPLSSAAPIAAYRSASRDPNTGTPRVLSDTTVSVAAGSSALPGVMPRPYGTQESA
jgi:hypothetical protein